ncbi:hypothetical protein [Pseudochelatococcus sp. G4_1912]|uniref:hypothetical protein n=1 Tax=Pseudochelatococcus sp. G4_1912 TaxID=3114288 RepID=UPI0039C7142A
MWGNSSRKDDEDEAVGAVSFDPFADLLLGLIAIVVPIIGLLLASGNGLSDHIEKAQPAPPVEESFVIVADARGLSVPNGLGDGALYEIPVGAILDDENLARTLRERRDNAEPVSLRIEANGLESAFLFEAVAAQHGPASIFQTRIGALP